MKLRDYLHEREISITDFAKSIGASRDYISRISLGKLKPSKWLAKEIERETQGKVTAEEMRGDDDN